MIININGINIEKVQRLAAGFDDVKDPTRAEADLAKLAGKAVDRMRRKGYGMKACAQETNRVIGEGARAVKA